MLMAVNEPYALMVQPDDILTVSYTHLDVYKRQASPQHKAGKQITGGFENEKN